MAKNMDTRRASIALIVLVLVGAITLSLIYDSGDRTSYTPRTVTVTETVTEVVEPGSGNGTRETTTTGPAEFSVRNGLLSPKSWEAVELLIASLSGGPKGYAKMPMPTMVIPEGMPLAGTVGAPITVTATAIPESEVPQDYSSTNVRVAGVDEYDIVKVNGTHAFIVTDSMLYTVKAWPPEGMEIVEAVNSSSLVKGVGGLVMAFNVSGLLTPVAELPSQVSIRGIHLVEDGSLIVVLNEYTGWMIERTIIVKYMPGVGVKDLAWVTGGLYDTRMINNTLVVVTNQPAYAPLSKPVVSGSVPDPGALVVTGVPETYVNVLTLDTSDFTFKYTGVLGPRATAVYMTREGGLYIAQSSWAGGVIPLLRPEVVDVGEAVKLIMENRRQPSTLITKIDPATATVVASTWIEGIVDSTWQMDEYRGYLRVVADRAPGAERMGSVVLYILNASTLEEVAELPDIAVNEDVYGVRFMGDTLYLVTFRRVDPLFAINLSDPRNPTIIGYLKAPGFDDYLHPLTGDILLGIGYEDLGRSRSVRLTLYQIQADSAPKPVARLYIEGDSVWTPLIGNPLGYKLFHHIPSYNTIVIPVTVYNTSNPTPLTGFAVIEYNTSSPNLTLKGILELDIYRYLRVAPLKSFHIEDTLYITGVKYIDRGVVGPGHVGYNLVVKAYAIETLEMIAGVEG